MSDKYAHLRPLRPRQCFRSDRVPKVRMTQPQAEAFAAAYPGYQAYECPECGHWHTGRRRDEELA